jgi:multimeric flavodoxin WrbA
MPERKGNLNDNQTAADAEADRARFERTVAHLRTRKRCLFLTTSNRWPGEKDDLPKSSQLARRLAEAVGGSGGGDRVTILDVPHLKIYPCEGNVSSAGGNNCGVKTSALKDREKNPSGCHRCWASFNNRDDELWQVSRALFQSDCLMLFGSVRWGQMNSEYQKLMERLTWIENRRSTLGESNLVGGIDAGIIAVGQNWRGREVVEVQKQVLGFFGFRVIDDLCWNWQYSADSGDESEASYRLAGEKFKKTFIGV